MGQVLLLETPAKAAIQPPRPAVARIHEDERRRFLRDRLELVCRTLGIVAWDLRLLRKAATEAACLIETDPEALQDPTLAELVQEYELALDLLLACARDTPRVLGTRCEPLRNQDTTAGTL